MLMFRYALELSLIVPAVIFAVLPVVEYLRFRSKAALFSSIFVIAAMILGGAYLGVQNKIRVRIIAIPLAVAIFVFYMIIFDTEIGKKLFCFSNALMLSVICPMYTITVNAPRELGNAYGMFTFSSGLVSLSISVIIGAIFFKTLKVKIPTLLKEDSIRDIWNFMFLIPLGMSALLYWMIPLYPAVVMTGRVRPVLTVLIALVAGAIFVLYHIFWWTVSRLTEHSRLQQENSLLNMEAKRYSELRNYMNETRALRHDFRQHVFVMSELADTERLDELKAYISQLSENASKSYRSYCANSAVDAVASHYDHLAEAEGIEIFWSLALPSVPPMKEPEYCAMLGNLIENAMNAVKALPKEKRKIKVISSMLSDVMLGLSVDNIYDGLPFSHKKGHGTGLVSVMNTVNRYGGNMTIKTEKNIFSVNIILYCNTN